MGINWWDEWNIGDDTIGQRYGATIQRYNLMNKLLDGLKNDPFSRRHIIDMYQYHDLNETEGLHPCAYSTSWSVRKVNGEYYLDMTLNQRSNDYIVANYINKTQYLALQMMVAGHLDYKVGKFCHLVQNLHIYDRHLDSAIELLNRTPLDNKPIATISPFSLTSTITFQCENISENLSPTDTYPEPNFSLVFNIPTFLNLQTSHHI